MKRLLISTDENCTLKYQNKIFSFNDRLTDFEIKPIENIIEIIFETNEGFEYKFAYDFDIQIEENYIYFNLIKIKDAINHLKQISLVFNDEYNKNYELLDNISIINEYRNVIKVNDDYCIVKREHDNRNFYVIDKLGNTTKFKQDNIVNYHNCIEEFACIKEEKYGFLSLSGNNKIACIYDDVKNYSAGLAPVKLNLKYGFIDYFNNTVIEHEYIEANEFCDGLALVKKSIKYGYIDDLNKPVIPFIFDEATNFNNKYANGKIAEINHLINIDGKILPTVDFDKIDSYFTDEDLIKVIKDERYCILDKYGNINFETTKIVTSECTNGRFIFKLGEKYGLLDKNGNKVIEAIYDKIDTFKEGLALVNKNSKYGFIDAHGEEVIPLRYDNALPFSNGLAAVLKSSINKYAYINHTNEIVHEFKYKYASVFKYGIAEVVINDTNYLINTNGDILIQCDDEEELIDISKDLIAIRAYKDEPELYIYDHNGNRVQYPVKIMGYGDRIDVEKGLIFSNECVYNIENGVMYRFSNEFIPFKNNIAIKRSGDKIYFIDKNDKEIFENEVISACGFSENLCYCVNKKYKGGFIDTNGNCVIPFAFDYLHQSFFSEGLAVCKTQKREGIIKKDGTILIPLIFDYISRLNEKYFYANLNGYKGIYNNIGENIIPCKYENIYHIFDSFFIVQIYVYSQAYFGIIDEYDNIIVPFDYTEIKKTSNNFLIAKHKNQSKYCIFNNYLRKICEPIYDGVAEISINHFKVCINSNYGIINNIGEIIVPLKQKDILPFSDGLSCLINSYTVSFVDFSGNTKFDLSLISNAKSCSNGFIAVRNINNLWGYCNNTGQIVIDFKYIDAFQFNDKYACVQNKYEKYLLIDKMGNEMMIKPFGYSIQSIYPIEFRNGFALLCYKESITDKKIEEDFNKKLANIDDNSDISTLFDMFLEDSCDPKNQRIVDKFCFINNDLEVLFLKEMINYKSTNEINNNMDFEDRYSCDAASMFNNNYAKIKINDRWRILNSEGFYL